ncbi:MAG: hypothetical protein DRI57_18510 [Deltaproteobacteria bacterium]|nr:MAG: hypothetical protein DRI57_18510 [Deltaproteobacteria bacterium]
MIFLTFSHRGRRKQFAVFVKDSVSHKGTKTSDSLPFDASVIREKCKPADERCLYYKKYLI